MTLVSLWPPLVRDRSGIDLSIGNEADRELEPSSSTGESPITKMNPYPPSDDAPVGVGATSERLAPRGGTQFPRQQG